ncbi:MAG: helix-turn-helix domain-containing protein [Candidatus Cloacimonetes bacterium]|nr:helix-turn-helix domain-containing protein [Candidatus Cloacimonadota bacterium]
MHTLIEQNTKDMEIKPIGKGIGLKKADKNSYTVYRYGVPEKQVDFKSTLDKRIFAVELVLKYWAVKRRVADILDISRKTLDVWIGTYEKGGSAALVNSSKKGGGRKPKEKIARPEGNKFNKYAQHKEKERKKQSDIEHLQLDLDFSSETEEKDEPSALFSHEQDSRKNRYAGSFIYWAIFQNSYSLKGLFTWLYGQYNMVVYLFLMMHVTGVKTIEQLKTVYKREFGLLIGLKCLPSHPVLWRIIHNAVLLKRSYLAMNHFFKTQISKGLVSLWQLFIDGHFIAYTGKEKVHKNYRTQSREMQPGQNEIFIHDQSGSIVYFEIQEGKGDMVEVIRRKSGEYAQVMNNIPPLFVVDRELWGVKKFQYLKDCRFVTWEKNTDTQKIKSIDAKYFNIYLRVNDTDYQIYETKRRYRDIEGHQIELRRIIIWNTKTNTRPVAVTNDTYEDTKTVARAMLNRWGKSENGFKHLGNCTNMQYNPLLDVTRDSVKQKIYNPRYDEVQKKIASVKKAAKTIYQKIGQKPLTYNKDGSLRKNLSRDRLVQEKQERENELAGLEEQIKNIPEYIDISESSDNKKFKMIGTEGKNLWDLAETIFWNSRKKLTKLFKQYLPNERDLLPVLDAITRSSGKIKITENLLIVKLEPLERPQFRHAQEQLCRRLNDMDIKLHNEKILKFDVG